MNFSPHIGHPTTSRVASILFDASTKSMQLIAASISRICCFSLLRRSRRSQPEVAASLRAQESALSAQQMPEQDHRFDHYLDEVNSTISQEYSGKSKKERHSEASEVHHNVVMIIDTFSEEACAKHSPLTTKRSAFLVLFRIGWAVCKSSNPLGDGVQKLFQRATTLQYALCEIIENLDDEETVFIRRTHDVSISFHKEVKSLMGAVAHDGIFTGLSQVLEQLSDMVKRRDSFT